MKTSTAEADLFDEIELDLLDEVDLPVEEKVAFSKEVKAAIREEIAKIPIGKIIAKIMAQEISKQEKSNGLIQESVTKEVEKTRGDVKKEIGALKEEMDDFIGKMRKKYDELKNDFLSFNGKQWYQFGGFSPQFNDLNIGDPAKEGSWRIVISGSYLVVQRLESGTWVEKSAFTP